MLLVENVEEEHDRETVSYAGQSYVRRTWRNADFGKYIVLTMTGMAACSGVFCIDVVV